MPRTPRKNILNRKGAEAQRKTINAASEYPVIPAQAGIYAIQSTELLALLALRAAYSAFNALRAFVRHALE